MTQHLIQKLRNLGMGSMATSLERQIGQPVFIDLSFEQKLSMLVDCELAAREDRRLARILKTAKLKHTAYPENIDYRLGRGLRREQVADILSLSWLERSRNGVISGPCGAGKTYLACAIGMQAARSGFTVQYHRLSLLLEAMELAHHNGSLFKVRAAIAKCQLLILDDFCLTRLTARNKQDMFELIEARVGVSSTILVGQLPLEDWHGFLEDPMLADAIMDRLVHNAFMLQVEGESMRKLQANL